jgi:hypothetical protein
VQHSNTLNEGTLVHRSLDLLFRTPLRTHPRKLSFNDRPCHGACLSFMVILRTTPCALSLLGPRSPLPLRTGIALIALGILIFFVGMTSVSFTSVRRSTGTARCRTRTGEGKGGGEGGVT